MSAAGGMIVDSALEAVRELVRVYRRSADLASDLNHAEDWLFAVVQGQEKRAEFLEGLAAVRNRGELPDHAYHQILATIARLLRGNIALVSECERITRK